MARRKDWGPRSRSDGSPASRPGSRGPGRVATRTARWAQGCGGCAGALCLSLSPACAGLPGALTSSLSEVQWPRPCMSPDPP